LSKTVYLSQRLGAEYQRHSMEEIIRAIGTQLDGIAEGGISFFHGAMTAAPTSSAVPYTQGDMIWNAKPSVMGTVGAQYTIAGWRCVVDGTPGTWVEMRHLTGT